MQTENSTNDNNINTTSIDSIEITQDDLNKMSIDVSTKASNLPIVEIKQVKTSSISSSNKDNHGTVACNDGPTESKVAKVLSDAELFKFYRDQEYEKILAKQARRKEREEPKSHKFWNTQPVLELNAVSEVNEPIDSTKTIADIKSDPYKMPAGYDWCEIDANDPVQLSELYTLLNENYVEDDDNTFRFAYSIPFLQWAMTPPGYDPHWHIGVRNTKTGALFGCITAIPVHIRVYDKVNKMAEINFLCVHKKLRTNRLAPVLIKEVTRRVNLTGVWQAVYTAGIVLPKPVARCQYYHRSINFKKLVEVGFTRIPPQSTMQSHIKKLKLPNNPLTHGLRVMVKEDVPQVHKLLTNYLDTKCKLAQTFTEEDLAHVLLTRKGVVHSYVVQAVENGPITDLCSFYFLNSSVMKNSLHTKLGAVYSYYNVATSIPLLALMQDCLILARNEGADVFNILNVMDNKTFFDELMFGSGDGLLQYYVYNWKCPIMNPDEVGLVLL